MTEEMKAEIQKLAAVAEKPWYKSKKFWIWFISYIGLGSALFWAIGKNADWKVQCAIVLALAVVSGVGMLGQAFVDAVVRFAQVWKGMDLKVWAEQPTKK